MIDIAILEFDCASSITWKLIAAKAGSGEGKFGLMITKPLDLDIDDGEFK